MTSGNHGITSRHQNLWTLIIVGEHEQMMLPKDARTHVGIESTHPPQLTHSAQVTDARLIVKGIPPKLYPSVIPWIQGVSKAVTYKIGTQYG